MGPTEICQEWRENKCFEFRFDSVKCQWYCGSAGVYRPHVNICRHWSPQSATAFSFTISASERLSRAINDYGRDAAAAAAQLEPVPIWSIPALADSQRTPVHQITDFISRRLVCISSIDAL